MKKVIKNIFLILIVLLSIVGLATITFISIISVLDDSEDYNSPIKKNSYIFSVTYQNRTYYDEGIYADILGNKVENYMNAIRDYRYEFDGVIDMSEIIKNLPPETTLDGETVPYSEKTRKYFIYESDSLDTPNVIHADYEDDSVYDIYMFAPNYDFTLPTVKTHTIEKIMIDDIEITDTKQIKELSKIVGEDENPCEYIKSITNSTNYNIRIYYFDSPLVQNLGRTDDGITFIYK